MVRGLLRSAIPILALLSLSSACGDGSDVDGSRWPKVLELREREITVLPLNHLIAVGDDRFIVALEDDESQLILDADVSFRFFRIEGEEGTLKAELPARFVGFEESFVHEHEDGTLHTHTGSEIGGYVARFAFDEPGDWGVEIAGQRDGEAFGSLRLRFGVVEANLATIPAIGDPAPPSEQLVLRDVDGIYDIDSTNPPNPEMHHMTVAEALDTGKPIVIAFTTPSFCTSRTCGPVMDEVVVPLLQEYRDDVVFIHIEPYDLARARGGEGLMPVPALLEWGLQTEPWVFVIGRDGRVAGKFEGIIGKDEVADALRATLGE